MGQTPAWIGALVALAACVDTRVPPSLSGGAETDAAVRADPPRSDGPASPGDVGPRLGGPDAPDAAPSTSPDATSASTPDAALDERPPPPDTAGDPPRSAPDLGPEAPPPAGCTWRPFSPPILVAGVNSSADDWAPAPSADGMSLYFATWRPGGPGMKDLWVASRAGAGFGAPMVVPAVNSPNRDGDPYPSDDGRELFFVSDRPGGAGGNDVWVAARAHANAPFGTPRALAEVNSPGSEAAPWLSPDGRRLYFTSNRGGRLLVYVASRTGPGAAFRFPAPVPGLENVARPTFSSDEREVFYHADRPGGLGKADVWTAVRADLSAPFAAPTNVAVLNTANEDGDAALSRDGTALYYNRDTAWDGTRNADIWVATRVCH